MQTQVAVRPFVEADADEVAALIRTTLLVSNASDYSRPELESLADWYAAGPLIVRMPLCRRFVAVVDGGIVGTAARRENRVEGFFVGPDWQGLGIGAQLLLVVEEDARTDALRALWLESSVTAVGFYEARGYVTTGPARDNGDGVVVGMRKRI